MARGAETQTHEERDRGAAARRRWLIALGIEFIALLLVLTVFVIGRAGQTTSAGGHAPPFRGSGISDGAGAGGPVDDDQVVRTVQITATDTGRFEPATIDVSVGDGVRLDVSNSTERAGLFVLGQDETQQAIAEMMPHMPEGPPHDVPYILKLEPGQTKELTWRFADAGVVEYAWYELGRSEAWMRGQVRVS